MISGETFGSDKKTLNSLGKIKEVVSKQTVATLQQPESASEFDADTDIDETDTDEDFSFFSNKNRNTFLNSQKRKQDQSEIYQSNKAHCSDSQDSLNMSMEAELSKAFGSRPSSKIKDTISNEQEDKPVKIDSEANTMNNLREDKSSYNNPDASVSSLLRDIDSPMKDNGTSDTEGSILKEFF